MEMVMSNTILITGPTGNVGTQVVKQLGETGIGFRVGARRVNDVRAAAFEQPTLFTKELRECFRSLR